MSDMSSIRLYPRPSCSSSHSLSHVAPRLRPQGTVIIGPVLPRRCNSPAPLQVQCMPRTGEEAWAVPAVPPRRPASLKGHHCRRWGPCLGNLPADQRFLLALPSSFLRACTQALSQVRPHPGPGTVETFLGTQMQGSSFHKEREEEEEAQNDHRAASKNEPLSALAQALDPRTASASHRSTGQLGKVQSQGGRESHTR